jgi:hypothetical protein
MMCDKEREKAEESARQPIFTADRNDPEDMELLKEVFGVDALQQAFGPGGGGMDEVHRNAAIASLRQVLRRQASDRAESE